MLILSQLLVLQSDRLWAVSRENRNLITNTPLTPTDRHPKANSKMPMIDAALP